MNKVEIFDFDGTLVRSPTRSCVIHVPNVGKMQAEKLYDKWLADKKMPKRKWSGWFGRSETLLHPIFPRPLQKEMLIEEVAQRFLQSKENPDVHTVIMTGRHMGLMHYVLDILFGYELLTKEDLKYQKVETQFFQRSKKTPETLDWKKEKIFDYASNCKEIEIWEDRQEHVEAFIQFGEELKELGLKSFVVNKVE